MAQQTSGSSEQEQAIAACLEAAQQFELTAGRLRARFYQAKSQPGGLTQADEEFLEHHAVSDAAGGRAASFHALNPVVKAVIDEYESLWRPTNWIHMGILAGNMGFGYVGRLTGVYEGDADQVRRGTRYALEVTRALQIAQLLRAKAAALAAGK